MFCDIAVTVAARERLAGHGPPVLIVEHGVASIPVSPFLYKDSGGPVLRFCFAKKDDTLRKAAERIVKI